MDVQQWAHYRKIQGFTQANMERRWFSGRIEERSDYITEKRGHKQYEKLQRNNTAMHGV